MARLFLFLSFFLPLIAQTGDSVLVVVNQNDPASLRVGEYYQSRRSIPTKNICRIETSTEENISWQTYTSQIELPVADCLKKAGLQEKVLYIVTTLGVPLKMASGEGGPQTENASVDSELTLLYSKINGTTFPRAGPIPNPFFGQLGKPFGHPAYPMYLVTRLGGWDFLEVEHMIDRGLSARNQGKFVFDLKGSDSTEGNHWLRTAAARLPADRVVLETTSRVLYGVRNVIGYASWGTNDPGRHERWMGFEWVPGAIVSDFVSTNGRSLKRPPDNWTFNVPFAGWQQNLSADYLHEGATGASANVYEPYLSTLVRPDYLFPAYFEGRNLAESYYMAMPMLSWQGVVLGDPLCTLGKP